MTDDISTENTFRRHVLRTLILAIPIILARIGAIALSTVDILVLARAGAQELANYVLGETLYGGLVPVVVGLLLGVSVLTSRLVGEGRRDATGAIWRRALIYGLLVGSGIAAVLQFSPQFLLLAGYDPQAAQRAGSIAAMIGFTMPFLAVYFVCASFLEALHRPLPGFIAILLANLGNLGLNIVLVFGAGPIPALGALGCAIATVINTALLGGGLVLYVRFFLPNRSSYGIGLAVPETTPPAREQRRIGYAAGTSFAFEATAFSILTLFVGFLGTTALAAHGILFQFLALTFMVAYGIAGATQVRVGNAWGRGDPLGIALAGWSGLALAVLFTLPICVFYLVFADLALRLFTDEAMVLATAAPVLIWMILALITDGGQTVVNSACRGRGDKWVPTLLHLASYLGIMVPSAWFLVFRLDHGLAGIYQAIMIASVFSIAFLSLRFEYLRRQTNRLANKPSG